MRTATRARAILIGQSVNQSEFSNAVSSHVTLPCSGRWQTFLAGFEENLTGVRTWTAFVMQLNAQTMDRRRVIEYLTLFVE